MKDLNFWFKTEPWIVILKDNSWCTLYIRLWLCLVDIAPNPKEKKLQKISKLEENKKSGQKGTIKQFTDYQNEKERIQKFKRERESPKRFCTATSVMEN